MITRFKRLSVQYKLFVVITLLAAAGAASILANLFTLIGFYSLGSELDRIYARNQEIYHTHQILQTLELAKNSYLLTADPTWADTFDDTNAQLETHLRQALLAASGDEQRAALYEIEQERQDYQENFAALEAAPASIQPDQTALLSKQSDEMMEKMYARLNQIGAQEESILFQTEESANRFRWLVTIVTLFTLGLFITISAATAVGMTDNYIRPLMILCQAVTAFQSRRFEPETLENLIPRQDEIGQLGREFVRLTETVKRREADLQQQADEIRARIH